MSNDIYADKIIIADLSGVTVAENTTLLDIYNQKVTLRSQLAS